MVSVAKEAETFLRNLAEDIGVNLPKTKWLVRNFENGSLCFDVESGAIKQPANVKNMYAVLDDTTQLDPAKQLMGGQIKHRTMLQFAKLTEALEPHEKIGIGLYHEDMEEEKPYVWRNFSKRDATMLEENLTRTITYKGSVQGELDTLLGGSLGFKLKLHKQKKSIHCDFTQDFYEQVAKAFQKRLAHVYVFGEITARCIDREIEGVKVEKLVTAPDFPDADYNKFFGFSPNYTGALSTEAFIDGARDYD